jgi:hypothetical protein
MKNMALQDRWSKYVVGDADPLFYQRIVVNHQDGRNEKSHQGAMAFYNLILNSYF